MTRGGEEGGERASEGSDAGKGWGVSIAIEIGSPNEIACLARPAADRARIDDGRAMDPSPGTVSRRDAGARDAIGDAMRTAAGSVDARGSARAPSRAVRTLCTIRCAGVGAGSSDCATEPPSRTATSAAARANRSARRAIVVSEARGVRARAREARGGLRLPDARRGVTREEAPARIDRRRRGGDVLGRVRFEGSTDPRT